MDLQLFNPDSFSHAVKLSETLARSSIVPAHFRGKGADVFAAMVLGSELGFSPMQSLNAIVMIQGNATLKAQTQLALVRSKFPKAIIQIEADEKNMVVKCSTKRDENDHGYTATWDMNKAKMMGLSGRDNWIKQPITMLRWRAISEALKITFPDVLQGIYTTEELEDSAIETTSKFVSDMDIDFPIDPADRVVGDNYLILNGKFRSKRFGEIDIKELTEYFDTLETRKDKKQWEMELMLAIREYLSSINDTTAM